MTQVHFTREQVRGSAEKMLAERGEDFVYVNTVENSPFICLYNHTDGPGCGVGWIYHDLTGQSVPEEYEGESVDGLVQGNIVHNRPPLFSVDEDAFNFLHTFQVDQDARDPYGQVMRAALADAGWE